MADRKFLRIAGLSTLGISGLALAYAMTVYAVNEVGMAAAVVNALVWSGVLVGFGYMIVKGTRKSKGQ